MCINVSFNQYSSFLERKVEEKLDFKKVTQLQFGALTPCWQYFNSHTREEDTKKKQNQIQFIAPVENVNLL